MAGNGQHLRLRRCILGMDEAGISWSTAVTLDEPVSPGLFGDGRPDRPKMLKVTVQRYKR